MENYTILVVEDNPLARTGIEIVLEPLGPHLDMAEDGAEAVVKFENNPERYDLVLMDLGLPKIDGLKATQLIREMEKGKNLKPTPIIALTAHGSEADRKNSARVGMTDFLTKPLTVEKFEMMIKKYVEA